MVRGGEPRVHAHVVGAVAAGECGGVIGPDEHGVVERVAAPPDGTRLAAAPSAAPAAASARAPVEARARRVAARAHVQVDVAVRGGHGHADRLAVASRRAARAADVGEAALCRHRRGCGEGRGARRAQPAAADAAVVREGRGAGVRATARRSARVERAQACHLRVVVGALGAAGKRGRARGGRRAHAEGEVLHGLGAQARLLRQAVAQLRRGACRVVELERHLGWGDGQGLGAPCSVLGARGSRLGARGSGSTASPPSTAARSALPSACMTRTRGMVTDSMSTSE